MKSAMGTRRCAANWSCDRLWTVAATGGKPTPVTSLKSGETGHRWPSFLPDNHHFLYLAQADVGDELRVGSLTSTDTVSLGAFESNARHVNGRLLFVRNERLMSQVFDTDALLLKDDPMVVAERVAVVVPWGRGQFPPPERVCWCTAALAGRSRN